MAKQAGMSMAEAGRLVLAANPEIANADLAKEVKKLAGAEPGNISVFKANVRKALAKQTGEAPAEAPKQAAKKAAKESFPHGANDVQANVNKVWDLAKEMPTADIRKYLELIEKAQGLPGG